MGRKSNKRWRKLQNKVFYYGNQISKDEVGGKL
jgi:hypothetical protein